MDTCKTDAHEKNIIVMWILLVWIDYYRPSRPYCHCRTISHYQGPQNRDIWFSSVKIIRPLWFGNFDFIMKKRGEMRSLQFNWRSNPQFAWQEYHFIYFYRPLKLRRWYYPAERRCTNNTARVGPFDDCGIPIRYVVCTSEVQVTTTRLVRTCVCTHPLWWLVGLAVTNFKYLGSPIKTGKEVTPRTGKSTSAYGNLVAQLWTLAFPQEEAAQFQIYRCSFLRLQGLASPHWCFLVTFTIRLPILPKPCSSLLGTSSGQWRSKSSCGGCRQLSFY